MKEITMVKHNNNAKKSRYRFLSSFLAVILMLGCMMIPDTKAQASSLSLGVSTSSVKIGDTVTVSITVPAGVSATVNVTYPSGVFSFSSASDTASSNGGTVSMTIGSYGSTNTKTTGTMKFKAKAAGSATFSASAPIAGNQDGDRVTVGGASASVRVKNESNDSTNDNSNNGNHANDGEDNTHKSADNSLASLTLSSGTLSPAFKYNVTNYTAEVANDVTSVVVSAKPSNANATVESVNGGENLAVGANKIQIVVKAENGVTATYTITVTRKESGDTDDSDEEDPAGTDEPQEQCYEIGGVKMYPSEDGDETQIPEGFTLSEITLWEKAYPYWVNETIGTDMGLIYLVDENKENGAWYRISEASPYDACAFLCFKSEYGYIIATPEKLTEAAPTGYVPETINIEGKGTVDAYVRDGDESTCLIYAVNQDGVYGWYRYDVQDRTYMRYTEEAVAEDTQQAEPSTEQSGSQMKDLESQMRLLFYAFIVVVAILLIVIVILIIKRKQDDDDDDDDDEWEEVEDDFNGYDEKENDPNDADHAEDELDLSDERTGASKRYDRSEFLTGNKATDDEAEEDEDDSEPDHAGQDEPEEEDPEVVTKKEEDPEGVTKKEEDPEVVTEPEQTPVMTNTLDLEAVLAQAVSETMHDTDDEEDYDFDDEEEEEKPKKKKEKRGFFGRRKKKKDDGDDDLEFLDL